MITINTVLKITVTAFVLFWIFVDLAKPRNKIELITGPTTFSRICALLSMLSLIIFVASLLFGVWMWI